MTINCFNECTLPGRSRPNFFPTLRTQKRLEQVAFQCKRYNDVIGCELRTLACSLEHMFKNSLAASNIIGFPGNNQSVSIGLQRNRAGILDSREIAIERSKEAYALVEPFEVDAAFYRGFQIDCSASASGGPRICCAIIALRMLRFVVNIPRCTEMPTREASTSCVGSNGATGAARIVFSNSSGDCTSA